eukprot:gnl/Trimastix_PCT/463.p1 GENE.gnl/Trimastix_PCT/463~~gnl/Trimastix_PCT/463.p1  ORF type:complete len:699 (-),score=143.98 gnl/Trimastix_PCT/463:1886-3982(-)
MSARNLSGRLARWALHLQELNVRIIYKRGKANTNADALSRCPGPVCGVWVGEWGKPPVRDEEELTADITRNAADDGQADERAVVSPVTTGDATREATGDAQVTPADDARDATGEAQVDGARATGIPGDGMRNANGEAQADEERDGVTSTDATRGADGDTHEATGERAVERERTAEQAPIWSLGSMSLDRVARLEDKRLPSDAAQARRVVSVSRDLTLVGRVLYNIWTSGRVGKRAATYKRLVLPKCLRGAALAGCHEDVGHLGEERTMWGDVRDWCRSCDVCGAKKTPRRSAQGKMTPIVASEPSSGNKYVVVLTDSFTKWPEAFATKRQDATTIARLLINHVICRHGAMQNLLSDRGAVFLSQVCGEVVEQYRGTIMERMREAFDLVRVNLERAHERQKASYDKRHGEVDPRFSVGARVWVFTPAVGRGRTHKLARLWRGPYRIVERMSPTTFRLKTPANRPMKQLVNVARLKLYHGSSLRPEEWPALSDEDTFDPDKEEALGDVKPAGDARAAEGCDDPTEDDSRNEEERDNGAVGGSANDRTPAQEIGAGGDDEERPRTGGKSERDKDHHGRVREVISPGRREPMPAGPTRLTLEEGDGPDQEHGRPSTAAPGPRARKRAPDHSGNQPRHEPGAHVVATRIDPDGVRQYQVRHPDGRLVWQDSDTCAPEPIRDFTRREREQRVAKRRMHNVQEDA